MKTFILENEPKIESGFQIPENYFETLSARIATQLPKEEPKIISIYSRRKTWMYAAAAVLVVGLSIPVYHSFSENSNEMDQNSLENYIRYQSSVSDVDIVNLLDEKDIQKIKIDLHLDEKVLENELSDSNDLEEYLLN